VIAGIVTGIAIMTRQPSARGGNPQVSLSPANPSTTDSPAEKASLPVSQGLTQAQLIVPVLGGDNWDLWLADAAQTTPVLRLTTDPAPDTTPAISPDRRTLIYTHDLNTDGKRTLLVKGASTTGDGRPLFDPVPTECQGTMFRPAWNPVDTNELAVPCVNAQGKYGLYRITTDGRIIGTIQLPGDSGRVDDPSYSPDGKQLVFWAAPPSTWDGGTLYTVPLSGGKPKVLVKTTQRGEDADPVWAPDGKHIAFRRRVSDSTSGGNFEIFRVTTDGSARLDQLTDDQADDQDPTYSPSGEWIAYKSAAQDPAHKDNAISRTWIMDADGNTKRVLWTAGSDNPQTAAGWGRR
jgi:molecular chaperone DnaK